MWWLTSVPAYIWWMLLLPSALVAALGALRRSYPWLLVFLFSTSTIIAEVTGDFYNVFVMKRIDPKFRDVPEVAFELEISVGAIVALVGLLVFGGTLALLIHRNFHSTLLSTCLVPILGAVYTVLPLLAYWAKVDIPMPLSWSWILCFPAISARMSLHRFHAERTTARSTPSRSSPR